MFANTTDFSRYASELLPELSKRELKAVDRLFTPLTVRQGSVLAREGDSGREAMWIAAGAARVDRDGTTIARLGPGEFFGELALLTGAPRIAMVTAETDMLIGALTRQEFATLLDMSPMLTQRILVDAVRRLRASAA